MRGLFMTVSLVVCLASSHAYGAGPTPAKQKEFASDVARDLIAVKHGLDAVTLMYKNGVITTEQTLQAAGLLLDQASKIAGRRITHMELKSLAFREGTASPIKLTALQRFAGLITFTNILWVVAIILGAVCFSILFGHWLKKLLKLILEVPPQVYEVLLGLAGLSLVLAACALKPGVKEYIAFTGCLLFGGSLAVAIHVHDLKDRLTAVFMAMAVVSAGSAVLHVSSLSGFLAVAALMGALGFSIIAMPLCYCIGFRDESSLGRATAAAFVMLIAFVLLRIFAVDVPRLMVFEGGALFLGAFVGYLGLLIASSRWYDRKVNYLLFQAVTVTAGVAALAVGSIWQIAELQRIGGTFFILYLVEKFVEIPARSVIAWAWKGLLIAGVIFGICMLIKTYSEVLTRYLLF